MSGSPLRENLSWVLDERVDPEARPPVSPGPALTRLTVTWDAAVAAFLDGSVEPPAPLDRWFDAYHPVANDPVVVDAIPEPYLGPLDRTPAGVILSLNPGEAHPRFQGRHGIFADKIRETGSYTAWAATWPSLREPWVSAIGSNRHHRRRLRFLRDWHQDDALGANDMVAFELYPWHTTRSTAKMTPDPDVIRQFLWEPILDLGSAPVFAFGAEWFDVLRELGLDCQRVLGHGGIDYGSTVESRTVGVFADDSGLRVIADKHAGSAGPPNEREARLLRDALKTFV